MDKNYPEITRNISANLRKLRTDIPDVMKGFSALAQAAGRDGALYRKTKELIALALGVAAHCDGCISFHTEALVKLGATRQTLARNSSPLSVRSIFSLVSMVMFLSFGRALSKGNGDFGRAECEPIAP